MLAQDHPPTQEQLDIASGKTEITPKFLKQLKQSKAKIEGNVKLMIKKQEERKRVRPDCLCVSQNIDAL
jgi:hypothetical protein